LKSKLDAIEMQRPRVPGAKINVGAIKPNREITVFSYFPILSLQTQSPLFPSDMTGAAVSSNAGRYSTEIRHNVSILAQRTILSDLPHSCITSLRFHIAGLCPPRLSQ
jgi:hypothetical protein